MDAKKSLSIKSKFIAGIVIVFLATAANVALFLYSLRAIEGETQDYETAVLLNRSLLEREQQHLQWVSSLSIYIISADPVNITLVKDARQCGFGKWYYSDMRKEAVATFPDIAKPLAAIEASHIALHGTAPEIETLVKANNIGAAQAVFRSKTMPALQEVQKQLTLTRERLQVVMQDAQAELQAQISTAYTVAIALGLIACLAVIALAAFLFTNILRPIEYITRFSQECRDGKDCTLNLGRTDELGVLAANLTGMVEHLGRELAFSQGILQGMAVPCSVFSAEDKTVFTNREMMDLIERSGNPADYYGQSSGEYIFGDKNMETLSTRALRENKTLSADREITTHKGKKRHARISSAPFHSKDGKPLGTLSIWMDMTDVVEKQRAIEENSRRIEEVAASAQDVAQKVSAASQEISVQVEQASSGASTQRDRVGETATAMSEMNATVIEVARSASATSQTTEGAKEKAQQGAAVVAQLMSGVTEVSSIASSVKDGMDNLGKQADGIGKIINVINDIADQTNLLALNAAIEAARAGDAGRGFAVVADEVRKLAEKTMLATNEVGSVITGIQKETQSSIANVENAGRAVMGVSELAQQAGDALSQIVSLVEEAAMQVHSIATAAEEQSATSNEINMAITDVASISDQTSSAMQEASKAVEDLADQANALRELIARLQQ